MTGETSGIVFSGSKKWPHTQGSGRFSVARRLLKLDSIPHLGQTYRCSMTEVKVKSPGRPIFFVRECKAARASSFSSWS
jgi:hypothetical protein